MEKIFSVNKYNFDESKPTLLSLQSKKIYETYKKQEQDIENTHVPLVNYHFAIELMLKAIIFARKNEIPSKFKQVNNGHNLIELLKYINNKIRKIEFNKEEDNILQELTNYFTVIRYIEGSISIQDKNSS